MQYNPHPKWRVWNYTPALKVISVNCNVAPSFEPLSTPAGFDYSFGELECVASISHWLFSFELPSYLQESYLNSSIHLFIHTKPFVVEVHLLLATPRSGLTSYLPFCLNLLNLLHLLLLCICGTYWTACLVVQEEESLVYSLRFWCRFQEIDPLVWHHQQRGNLLWLPKFDSWHLRAHRKRDTWHKARKCSPPVMDICVFYSIIMSIMEL